MRSLKIGIMAVCLVFAASALAEESEPSLEGVWRGGGTVIPANGQRERASCRVTFKTYSKKSYKLLGSCATASLGKVKQTAVVQEAGQNRYRGNFRNPEYNVSGKISIKVNNDKKQTITLTTKSGKGVVVLTRR